MAKTIVVPSRPKKLKYCGVSLDEEMRVEIERIAAAKDVSMAWVIRDALKEYIERGKDE